MIYTKWERLFFRVFRHWPERVVARRLMDRPRPESDARIEAILRDVGL